MVSVPWLLMRSLPLKFSPPRADHPTTRSYCSTHILPFNAIVSHSLFPYPSPAYTTLMRTLWPGLLTLFFPAEPSRDPSIIQQVIQLSL